MNDSIDTKQLFEPALDLVSKHVDEAIANPRSSWRGDIVLLAAFTGIMPTPPMITLFNQMLDSENSLERNRAFLALTRVRPLPSGVKEILLSRVENLGELRGRLDTMIFALDDSDVLAAYLKYLESSNVEEQRTTSNVLRLSGSKAKPLHNALLHLQKKEGLDQDVKGNVGRTIEQLELKLNKPKPTAVLGK